MGEVAVDPLATVPKPRRHSLPTIGLTRHSFGVGGTGVPDIWGWVLVGDSLRCGGVCRPMERESHTRRDRGRAPARLSLRPPGLNELDDYGGDERWD